LQVKIIIYSKCKIFLYLEKKRENHFFPMKHLKKNNFLIMNLEKNDFTNKINFSQQTLRKKNDFNNKINFSHLTLRKKNDFTNKINFLIMNLEKKRF
jgi:hypothetical protein